MWRGAVTGELIDAVSTAWYTHGAATAAGARPARLTAKGPSANDSVPVDPSVPLTDWSDWDGWDNYIEGVAL